MMGCRSRSASSTHPCTIVGRFPEGTHRVVFDLTTAAGEGRTSVEVVVQDWLMVGIGEDPAAADGDETRIALFGKDHGCIVLSTSANGKAQPSLRAATNCQN